MFVKVLNCEYFWIFNVLYFLNIIYIIEMIDIWNIGIKNICDVLMIKMCLINILM